MSIGERETDSAHQCRYHALRDFRSKYGTAARFEGRHGVSGTREGHQPGASE